MFTKKKIILFSVLFVTIFVGLLLVATFYDYQITDLLAKKGLQGEIYYSHNVYGRIFEVIGEMPLYLFCVIAGAILIVKGLDTKKIVYKILLIIIGGAAGMAMGFYGWYKLGFYFSELYPTTCSFLHGDIITYIFMVILSGIVLFTATSLFRNKIDDKIDTYLPIACIIILAALLSNCITQFGMKPFFGRERYRAIRYFSIVSHSTPDQGFTKWFVLNGSSSEIAATFNDQTVTKDFFKSFPSGHATACGIVYVIALLPLYFEKLNNKLGKLLCSLIPFAIMAIVCIARLVMGAHYFSDVLVGGTLAFASVVVSYILYEKLLIKLVNKMNN